MTSEERLERLERELSRAKARYRWLLGAVGFAIGLYLLAAGLMREPAMAQEGSADGQALCARSLELVDESGRTRFSLSAVGPNAGSLMLKDEKGNIRMMLSLLSEGPGLMFLDEAGKHRMDLFLKKDTAVLAFSDKNDHASMVLGLGENGPGLKLGDRNGKPRVLLGVTGDSGPALKFMSAANQPQVTLTAGDDGPLLSLSGKDDKGGFLVGRCPLAWVLRLDNENSKAGFSAIVGDTAHQGLVLNDEKGQVIWTVP